MARASNRRQREAARERARLAAEARQASTRRRQRILAATAAVLVLLSVVAASLAALSGSSSSPTTTTSSVPSTPTTPGALPATGVAPTPAPMGASLPGPTPCPEADGSSPRTTLFAEPPPTCIDTSRFHVATIATSAGELSVQLNPRLAPESVNAFVVLARYHFYDGQPVTSVAARQSFAIGLSFTGDGADRAPGFAIPDEAPDAGTVFTSGMLALAPPSGGPGTRGQLVVATYERSPGIDQGVTVLGVMLSGEQVLKAIDDLASEDGLPTSPVTVTSITVEPTSPIPG